MRLSDETAKTLAGLAVLLLAPGLLIASPTGRFFFLVLAAFVALIPLVFGSTKRRILAGVIMAVSLLVGAATYPEFRKDYGSYLERARQKGKPPSAQPAPPTAPKR